MTRNDIERLHYYQRQYLGAEDFEAEQEYHRGMRRRHNLGPHTWGIVAGLELVEVKQEGGGGIDVYVLPGLAVDGFGREIVVLAPAKLGGELFEPFRNQPDRYLPVWIGYDQELTGRPRAGYELCDVEDQFSRVREGFRLEIDPREPFHDDLVVAGHPLVPGAEPDPAAPPGDVSTLLTVPRDGSAPYQELPDDGDRPRWLVPLGNVHWDGQKLVPDAADPPRLSQDRRYAGAVAEEVLAPQGRLTLRHRRGPEVLPLEIEPPKDDEDIPEYGVQAAVEGSLEVTRRVEAKGNLLVGGSAGVGAGDPDARLHVDGGEEATLEAGGYLVIGDVGKTNLVLDDDEIMARDGKKASTLRLQAQGGDLVVHRHREPATRVVIKDEGNVGIGTGDPKVKLQVAGDSDARLDDEAAGLVVIGSPAGADLVLDPNEIMARNATGKSSLHLQAEGGDLRIHDRKAGTEVVVRDSGWVGIGTGNPDARLVLGSTGGLNLAADRNRLQARDNGSASVLHLQRNGGGLRVHDNEASDLRKFAINRFGQVGVGTDTPGLFTKLDVRGMVRATSFDLASDARWKKNVAALEPPLARLGRLRGVRFEWRSDELEEMGFEEGERVGLVAQEVEEVFPQLVRTDERGFKSVDVFGLVPVLLEAVKELAARNEALEARVATLEKAKARPGRRK